MPTLRDYLPLLAALNNERSQRVSLGEIATAFGLSPWHVQRTFAEVVGESPKKYRLRIRLESAAALLLATDETVVDIALAVGFDSHEGFTRAFRKRFSTSPSRYRAARAQGTEVLNRHQSVVDQVSPCVTLFGASTENPSKETSMSYDITKQTLSESPILFIRRRVDSKEVAAALGEILPAVFSYAMEKGLAMAGPPFTRYGEWSPAFVTLEAGVPLAEAAKIEHDEIIAGALPGGDAAVTIHTGPYDTLGDAHAAVERWLADNELEAGGKPWEIYLTDPGEVPDPAEWKTQVIWPIG